LTNAEFTKDEVDAAENFIPKYVNAFVDCVGWQEEMKLVKIHLLVYFVDCMQLYGNYMNFNGANGELHLKNKQKAWRTECR